MDRTLLCLQQHIHRNVPIAADCARAWRSAYDSHPGCYVRGGICTLGAAELLQILATIDLADLEARQALITALSCGGMGISMGVGGGFRGLMERDRARQRQLMNPPPP